MTQSETFIAFETHILALSLILFRSYTGMDMKEKYNKTEMFKTL